MKKSAKVLLYLLVLSSLSFLAYREYGGQIRHELLRPPPPGIEIKEDVLKRFDFTDRKTITSWKNKVFKGKTTYSIEERNNERFLRSLSKKTSSALYRMISYDINKYPVLSWRWRPAKFPDKKTAEDAEEEDDYALRIYVVFASGFFTNFRVVEYVWDEHLKQGTLRESPYSGRVMQYVLRSDDITNEWISEERNVYKDYLALFGEKPKMKVRAIAVMSDSDGTQDSSEGHFQEIKILRRL